MTDSYFKEYLLAIKNKEIIVCNKIIKMLLIYKPYFTNTNTDNGCFNKLKSDRAIQFIESFCRHSKGAGFAGELIKLELWQKVVLELIFGIVDKDTGYRIVREVFLVVGRKNGKSTFASAISLYMLVMDKELSSDIYCVATKLSQAKIIYNECYKMAKQDDTLVDSLILNRDIIHRPDTFGTLQALASDATTLDGLNPHLVNLDEVHAMKSRDIYDIMISAFGSRTQQLLLMITTAGVIRDSIYDDLYDRSEKILDGYDDKSFIPIIFELDDIQELSDINMMIKANPSIGVSKSYEYMEQQIKAAIASPADKVNFLTKHCNIRQNGSSKWLNYKDINQCSIDSFKELNLKGHAAVAGVDLAMTTDLTSASILIPHEDGSIYCIQQNWIPYRKMSEAIVNHQNKDKAPYHIWSKYDYIRSSGTNNVDYTDIREWFLEITTELDLTLLSIGFDNWNAKEFCADMESYGFNMDKVIQGAKTMSEPMKKLELDIINNNFKYDNECLKMALINCSVDSDVNGNIRPSKAKSNKKIDPAVATINAYVRLVEHKEEIDYINN